MDPTQTVLVDADTTFALLWECQTQGHQTYHCLIQDVIYDQGRIAFKASPATLKQDANEPMVLGSLETIWAKDIDVVLVRKDPPFDSTYLWATQLLELAKHETLVVNDPKGLREANEKLYALNFRKWMPETLVASRTEEIVSFAHLMGGQVVIKPLSGAGGDSVFLLSPADRNHRAIIETVTQNGKRVAMVQKYLPEVVQGDKRILLLDGEPLGAIWRIPRADDVRSNIHVGGSVTHADVSPQELEMIKEMGPKLKADGLYFVGLDVIGGKLTEVNVTSPTGIQQMSRLTGQNLSAKVVDWLSRRTAS